MIGGELSDTDFKLIEDRAVDEAVALQERAGVAVVTDGEMRRYAFYGHLIDAVDGFDKYGGWAIPFRNEAGEELVLKRPVVVSRLKKKRHLCAEEFTYLRARTRLPCKVTLISAQQAAAYYDSHKSRGAYLTIDSYLADLVDILRNEIEELIRLGVPIFKSIRHIIRLYSIRNCVKATASAVMILIDCWISQLRWITLLSEIPGILFGLHLCRGNNQSRFYARGDYGPITKLFQNTRFQRFLLEYDDERSGGFEPLDQVPEERTVVLGLFSSRRAQIEDREELRRRIKEASAYKTLDTLALSPQCGFASTLEGNLLTVDDQEVKLRLVATTAREVWG